MQIQLISFGFKNNSAPDANYVVDVRFLNNPFYVDELRELTGLDSKVISYFKDDVHTQNFLKELFKWTTFIVESNYKARREKVIFAIGCTGGQHRSTYTLECLANYLGTITYVSKLTIYHRELNKYNVIVPKNDICNY